MTSLAAILLMQYVVSVKAGLVNHVQGTANIAEMEMARVARPIRTGSDGYVEILLRPGSFLRLGENSEAVFNDVDLSSIDLTVTKGPAVIEVIDINRAHPITVQTGNLKTKVIAPGIYRFEDGAATVIQGKLQAGDSNLTYEKNWQLFFKDNYRARKIGNVSASSLDLYSQARSLEIARANFELASSITEPTTNPVFDAWLFSPLFGMYTFMPRSGFRSPYGFQYIAVRERHYRPSVYYPGNSGTTSSTPSGGVTPTTPINSGNNSGGGGGGGAPAPTASTPSGEKSTPSTYIESKSSPVGATNP